MNSEEILEVVKGSLGYPTIRVFTSDATIQAHIQKAYRKFTSKILKEKTVTVSYGGASRIDLTEHGIEVVLDVGPELSSAAGYSGSTSNNDFNEFDQNRIMMGGQPGGIENYVYYLQRRADINYLAGAFDWNWIEPFLYLDNIPGGASYVTILGLYKPTFEEAEYENWVEDYALALTKITEGRIRSKYSGGPMEFSLDGEALISEGKEEVQTLEDGLNTRAPLRGIRRA